MSADVLCCASPLFILGVWDLAAWGAKCISTAAVFSQLWATLATYESTSCDQCVPSIIYEQHLLCCYSVRELCWFRL